VQPLFRSPPILSKDSDKRAKNMKLPSIFSLRVQYPFTKIASFAGERLFFIRKSLQKTPKIKNAAF
jgi:hypothetical protein